MTTQVSGESSAYEPTQAQLQRVSALRRFNWLYVYTPVLLLFLAALVIIGLLLWGSLSPNIGGTAEFASALADIIITLTILPLFLLCAIVPVGAIALFAYRKTQPKKPYSWGYSVLWRLDSLVDRLQGASGKLLGRTAGVVIEGHARGVYLRTLIARIKGLFGRS